MFLTRFHQEICNSRLKLEKHGNELAGRMDRFRFLTWNVYALLLRVYFYEYHNLGYVFVDGETSVGSSTQTMSSEDTRAVEINIQ